MQAPHILVFLCLPHLALPACTDTKLTLGGKTYSCSRYASFCTHSAHGEYIRKKCPKTCNSCPSYAPTATCSDVGASSSCSKWAAAGDCTNPDWIPFMTKNCKKTCSLCGWTHACCMQGMRSKDEPTKRPAGGGAGGQTDGRTDGL